MSGAGTYKAVDWNEALKAWNVAVDGGPMDRFVELTMPVAQRIAAAKAYSYQGSNVASSLNEDDCLEKAMEALIEVAAKRRPSDKGTPEWLEKQCSVIIGRRLTDLERTVLGRNGKSMQQRTRSMDEVRHEGDTRQTYWRDTLTANTDIAEKDTRFEEARERLLARMKKLLSAEQYVVFEAVVTYRPQGESLREIGERIGKSEITISSTMNHCRKRAKDSGIDIAGFIRECASGESAGIVG